MMQYNNGYHTNRHAVYRLQYHLVVCTEYRYPILTGDIKDRLIQISYAIIEDSWKSKILEITTDVDHVHILFETSPQTQLSRLINNYKTVTSRLLRKEFSDTLRPDYWRPHFWSDTYFISTVSDTTEQMIRRYIQEQGQKKNGAANPA
ncbi:MAG: IS200/IS605 family transposase [Lactimicrobium sp.]|jgi:putative transposase|uniref:IS200/IS605 family transposase n=1 Tax=Lactimicrobium sp. TaxID=2563780 RepID=UPI002F354A8E